MEEKTGKFLGIGAVKREKGKGSKAAKDPASNPQWREVHGGLGMQWKTQRGVALRRNGLWR